MRFFPSLTETLTSPLPPAELLARVQLAAAPPLKLSWAALVDQFKPNPVEPFRGTVAAGSFELQRVIYYRNSMLPRITGVVEPGPGGGSTVRLRHQLHPFVLGFAGLWLGIVGLVALTFGAMWVSDRTELGWFALMPVGMLVGGVALFVLPFWYEVRKSRPLLMQLLLLEAPAN